MKGAIKKHLTPFVALLGLIALAIGVASYILTQQGVPIPFTGDEPLTIEAELPTAQAVLHKNGFDGISVAGKAGVSQEAVARAAAADVPLPDVFNGPLTWWLMISSSASRQSRFTSGGNDAPAKCEDLLELTCKRGTSNVPSLVSTSLRKSSRLRAYSKPPLSARSPAPPAPPFAYITWLYEPSATVEVTALASTGPSTKRRGGFMSSCIAVTAVPVKLTDVTAPAVPRMVTM